MSTINRRGFLSVSAKTGLGIVLGSTPLVAVGRNRSRLSILFTNDWHSRIEPFPMDGGKYQGLGGAAKRAALINQIRSQEKHTLLLDSGDIFQGTPYFNLFGGELEFKLMSAMKYDAATLGNHDFDAGLDGFKKQVPHASFPFINCNYDFKGTVLQDVVLPYKVFTKGGSRIGVLGVGIELNGLVPDHLHKDVTYLDPILKANETAAKLKHEEKCDLIVCLSHLGFKYDSDKVSDIKLAQHSEHIDLILGGHTHTFLNTPEMVINKSNKVVNILQTGWAGINLGKIDYERHSILEAKSGVKSMIKIC
ncbi:MAG: metallophosphatase [Bacteroidia bacterium]|nr:metallophosphatase [Bacteroidia bacterium]